MKLLDCFLYIAGIGVISNVIGAAIDRRWLHADRFPFRIYQWEQKGQFYVRFGIRKWKDKMPDMSKLLPFLYRKKIAWSNTEENLRQLIQEACVAELIHTLLIIASLGVTRIWPGKWGWFIWLLCLVGNMPFVIIQRFNRPRFARTLERIRESENKVTQ